MKRTQHSKKAVVDAQARRAGVAALELSVLMELHGGTYATGKQLSDAISVSLQLLLRSKEGKLSKIQKHVRDILLRIVSADLSVPETFKSGYTIIAMLLYDLKKGQLSLDKYREKLAVLSRKDNLNAYSGVAMNNNNQNHVSVAGQNATGSGRNQVGKVRSDDNLNEFVMQRQLQTQLQHQQILQQQQIAAKMQEKKKNKTRRPVGRPPKNYQQKSCSETTIKRYFCLSERRFRSSTKKMAIHYEHGWWGTRPNREGLVARYTSERIEEIKKCSVVFVTL